MSHTPLDIEKYVEELIKYRDYLVPVIGDELFYVEGEDCTLHEFIAKCFEKDFPAVAMNVSEEERLLMCDGGYDGLTLLSHRYNADNNYESKYIGYIERYRNRIRLNDTIKEYMLKTRPNLIVTTSSFSLLEKELGLDKQSSFWYSIDDNQTKNKDSLSPKGIMVYHLFGDAEAPMPEWVYNDISLLKFIHCLHDKNSSPDGLTQYLKRRFLLILGCKLPNWFFQFILYPLNKELIINKRGARQGFWLRDGNDEPLPLKSFLDGINFLSGEKMENVIAEVNKRLEVKVSSDDESDDDYDVFISHAGEDSELAIRIAEHLQHHGLCVWIDRNRGNGETEKAGDYMVRIKHGIEHSRYFMPIVTSRYLQKCRQGDFGKETDMAVDWYKDDKNECNSQDGIKVYSLPVVIDQASYDTGKLYNILPVELFGTNHYYTFTGNAGDGKETFLNHPWANFMRKK